MPRLLVGHRGYPAKYPENTIASFLAALFYGADGLELDMWLSKDGELVVIHDPDTERVAGKKLVVKETTFEELRQLDLGLGQRIPTLREVLEAVPPDIPLFVEIKDVDAAVPALHLILEKNRLEKTMFVSFKPEALEAIRRESNEAQLGFIIGSMEAAQQAPILAQKLGLVAIAPPILGIKYLGLEAYRDYLKKMKKMGLYIAVWTVDRPEDLVPVKDLVDAVITNDVETMKKAVKG